MKIGTSNGTSTNSYKYFHHTLSAIRSAWYNQGSSPFNVISPDNGSHRCDRKRRRVNLRLIGFRWFWRPHEVRIKTAPLVHGPLYSFDTSASDFYWFGDSFPDPYRPSFIATEKFQLQKLYRYMVSTFSFLFVFFCPVNPMENLVNCINPFHSRIRSSLFSYHSEQTIL